MYTITVKIAASGTAYTDPKDPHNSLTGHMWYSLAEDGVSTGSFGFAPVITEMDGPGKVYRTDDQFYAGTYYTGTIIIDKEQYVFLENFVTENLNEAPYFFDSNYNGLTNSCVDYVWKAINVIGLNPSNFQGDTWPTMNADNVDGSLYSYLFGNTSDWNSFYANHGNYNAIYGSNGDDILDGDATKTITDAIYGGNGNDAIYGSSFTERLYGGNDNDILSGGAGSDTLDGGKGDDVLMGNDGYGSPDTEADYLSGGEGFDTYIAGNGDTINDTDGKGLITFGGADLTGVKTKVKDAENLYKDKEGFTYEEKDGKLIITKDTESITVENWSEVVKTTDKTKEALGIKLSEGGDVEVSTESNSALEILEEMPIPVKLDRVVGEGEKFVVQVGYYSNILQYVPVGNPYWVPVSRYYNDYTQTWHTSGGFMHQPTKVIVIGQAFNSYGEVTFTEGEQEKDFIYRWNDDSIQGVHVYPNPSPMTPKLDETNSTYSDSIKITIGQSGTGIIIDDDPQTRIDPLILDTNKDGFISTTSLETSTTYFDITGDGLRERVGWVSPQDALLVYDKNENGRIDGIDEMFGNLTQSGFDDLKQTIDSNHDNKIDRKDELFNQLQVWNDLNQDAKVQTGELRSLDEAGVKDIDLNLVETNIEINGNTLTEASKYTTDTGAHELVADVQLAIDTKDTTLDPADIPQFSVDVATLTLPHLKGSGQVYDSFIAYNVDPEFKAIALAYANDLSKLQKNPDALIENWSGYTQLISQYRERYSMPEFNMSEADKKAWIADKFFGTDTFMSDIEAYYTTNLNKGISPSKPLTNDSNATSKYDVLRDRSESSFAILSHYQDLFSNTHYDMDNGKFVIDDEVAFNSKMIHYFNTDANSIEDKLYLATVLEMQHSGLIFNRNGVAQNINNDITQELVKDIFAGKEVNFINQSETIIKDIVIGSTEADILNIGNTNAKIVLNTGDDKLIAGKGNNEYFYRRGDGHDIIQDGGGVDTLTFDEAITRGDVIVKLVRNADLVIALKEEGKSFDELQNTITIVDFMKSSNRFEVIQFGDGETLRFKEVLEQYQASDANEFLILSAENDTINAGGGDDVIQALGGNDKLIGGKGSDRLEGGDGNDTYVYSKGDGKDTIIDTAGHDTLQFTAEITGDDLVAKYQGSDLLIGLKEAGKSFDELSDVITLKNYKNSSNTIEAIYFDGYQRVDIDSLLNAPTEEADILELGNSDDTIDLLGGNDTVASGGGNDTLFGGAGDDLLQGDDGNDVLAGGIGNDSLKGGRGNDTYIFNRGDGKDTIYDDFSYGNQDVHKENAGTDTLQLGEGIGAGDILYRYEGANLIIALKEEGKSFEELSDVIVIKNYTNSNNKIENILLSDGSSVAIESVKNGTNGNDSLNFKDSTEDMNLQGLRGFDFIHSGSGNDNIQGEGDPDTLYAGDGNDTLSGGNGDDFLAGGSGNDRYIFKRGDGNDVILDDNRPEYINFGTTNIKINNLLAQMELGGTAKEDAGVDTLEFGEGISREDISYSVAGNDLIVTVAGSGGGTIRIVNHLLSQNKIENIVLADGTVVDFFAATDLNDNLIFDNEATTINALGGDDIVATGTGNDTITGGKGADTLKGGNGNDTYIFNKGDGKDSIEDTLGVDTLNFGANISQNDVIVKLIGRDLVIALKEEGKSFKELSDVITIKNHTNTDNKLENISFADGTVVDVATIALGTEENDNFIFGSASTTINALGGDDIVATGNGNDTITGGIGADTLKGGNGDDAYIFNKGDGKDSIEDTLGLDTLNFGANISQNDVIVKLIGRDLVIALKEEGKSFEELSDVITIKNHTNIANKLENISFVDGTIIDVSTIALGTGGNDNFIFGSASTTINALGGDDIVATGNGNDTINGGVGADTLKSGNGEDTLIGGSGNDTLMGGRENDTYVFSRGDGKDIIHDYVNGIDVWGGTLSFDKNESTDKVIVNVTGSSLEATLRSMEREFYKIATHFSETDGLKAEDIFIKLVGDELIIAKFENGKFENWSNKIIFKQTISGNGVYSYEEIATQGSLDIEYLQDSLAFTTQAKNKEGETITSTLTFTQSLNAGDDTLKFGEGVSQDDIAFKFVGNDLILGLKEDGKTFDELSDTVTLKDYINGNNKVEHIVFNDGSVFNFDTTPMPTEGDDYLVFGNKSTTINLLGGNDIAITGSGNDTILGGSGNDKLESGAGADHLEGGLGSDTLSGGLGNDTYFFNKGDGQDTISDDGGLDTLIFGSGIAQSDLLLKQEGNDLWVALKDADTSWDALSDKILLKDWFSEKRNIESISLMDGTSLSATQIATMVLDNQPDTLYSKHGAIMTGGFGDDTYVYKKDDFTVIVNDQFKNNEIAVNAGNDTLKFEDITRDKITIGTKGNDLIIKIDATHDTYTELKDYVVIRDWRDANRGIESIVFGDGETLNIDKTVTYPPLEFDENWITSRYYIYDSENNIIEGTDASEVIESGAGDDVINAKDGSDYLTGGLGNDIINGGKGNDTYVFNVGDGHDTIIDEQGVDTIKFGSGITHEQLQFEQVGTDLVIGLKENGKSFDKLQDKITLKEWYNKESIEHKIELLSIEGKDTVAIADFIIPLTEDDDVLKYGDENNTINTLGGNDTIHIGGGNDKLYGNNGNDILYGEKGNDLLSGDSGNDTLYGGEGDDTYLFGRGDGKDTIIEDGFTDWGQTGKDTVSFKEGISSEDLILIEQGDDLIVALREDGKSFEELSDVLTLKKWALYDDANSRDYSRDYFTVEAFKFNDGTSWSMADIIAHIGTEKDDVIQGFNDSDTLNGGQGNDILKGHLGDDTYVFNRGDGKDVIYDYGRKGDDYSYYNAGNDTLQLGIGIGTDDFFVQKFEDNNDIIIYLHEDGKTFDELSDKVTIKDWFKTNNRIENLVLADGSKIDLVAYLNAGPTEGKDKLVYGNSDDVVDALAGDDIIIAGGGNDYMDGNSGNDQLEGGEGDDTLLGNTGDDTLYGGLDDDRLEGGEGSDTYLFNLGDGHDTISDYTTMDGEIDTITFGNDIDASNVQFTRNIANDKDLIITIDENNSIKVENWFLEKGYKLETLTFTDGTILSHDDVENRVIFYGDANDNSMEGTDNSELAIYGYEGNDTIHGNSGDDTLDGGVGNDRLEGGSGNDIYIFKLGDGHDTISDYTEEESEIDKVVFGANIVLENLQFIRRENDLNIIIDENNSLKVENWFLGTNYKLEKLAFMDGTVLSIDDVENRVIFYGDENDNVMVGTRNTELGIYGFDGNDTITGNAGDELIDGGNGNDTYIFNRGSGRDIIVDSSGVDTIKFASGITMNDLFIKKDGENLLVALYEDGKDFETFSDVMTMSINDIEKIVFNDESGLDIKDIMFENVVTGEILEKDQISTVYTGNLNEDSSTTPHTFRILSDTIQIDSFFDMMQGKFQSLVAIVASPRVSDVSITIINEQTGEYELSGNFDALQEGEKVTVSFDYEVNYDSDDNSLVSGSKKVTLVVTGTNDLPEVSGDFIEDVIRNTTIGTLSIEDADHNQNEFQVQQDTLGTYGKFSISAYGEWQYDLNTKINPEDIGKTETFKVTSKDGSVTKDIVLTISEIGANQAPIVVPQIFDENISNNPVLNEAYSKLTYLNIGEYVVSWEDVNTKCIYFQRYDKDNNKLDDIQVVSDQYLDDYSNGHIITTLKEDGFVVSWHYSHYQNNGWEQQILVQQYNLQGQKIGNEMIIDQRVGDFHNDGKVTLLDDGSYIVSWILEGETREIFFQRVDRLGNKIGEITNIGNEGHQQDKYDIKAIDNGSFVVVWHTRPSAYAYIETDILLQKFDVNNQKIGDAITIASHIEPALADANITILNDGSYVVTWLNKGEGDYDYFINLQQFNINGQEVNASQKFYCNMFDNDISPEITVMNGGYVLTWHSLDGGEYTGTYTQLFSSNGQRIGEKNQINTSLFPQTWALNDGGYIIVTGSLLQKFDNTGQKINEITINGERINDVLVQDNDGYVVTYESSNEVFLQHYNQNDEKVGEVQTPNTHFTYKGQSLSGNLDYIVDPDGDTLSYSAIVPNNMAFYIDETTGHWEYYYGGSGEVEISVDDGKGGLLEHVLTFNTEGATASPLVLDLNHNGKSSIALNDSIAYFDYDGDGNKEHTAWMEKGDAQLVVDINHDGKINNGSEIFGEYTKLPNGSFAKDGYEALAQYDTNGDRVIDRKDEAFGNLLLWNDANQNGKSEEGELTNIQLSNVTAIYLDRENGVTFEQREEAGNTILNETTYKGIDGDGIIRDVGFAYDAMDTITNNDTLDKEHYGTLLSGEDGNDTYIYNLGNGKIIIADLGDGNDVIRFGNDIVPGQILVKWDKATGDLIIGIRESIYDPSSITEVSNQIRIQNWFEKSGSIENFKFANGQSLTKESLYDLLLSTKEERSLTARVLEENGSLEGGIYSDLLYGTSGQEALYGMAGNDYLKGLEGDDLLEGGEGNDILVGGLGDDNLIGGTGDDLYIYNRGDGRDFITDFLGKDTIAFGEGIIKNDLIWEIVGTNLVLGLKEEGKSFTELTNTITIENWEQPGFGIEYVEFYDGTILSLDDLRNQAPVLTDTQINITLQDLRQSTGTIAVTDPDGDVLSYVVKIAPSHGTLSIDNKGSWVYKANAGYVGSDSVIVSIDDGNGGVVEQALNFTLAVSAPSITTKSLSLLEDTPLNNLLDVKNPVGGALTYEILNATTHGAFTLTNDGTYSYNPLANYNGLDSVTLKVTNEYGLSTTQVIGLSITSVNDAPIVTADTVALTLHDIRNATGYIQASDVDGDTLRYSTSTNPEHGTLNVDSTTGQWSYVAVKGYIGADSAIIQVNDGNGGVVEQTLNFTLAVSAPSITTKSLSLLEDTLLNNLLTVNNPVGGTLTYEILNATTHGAFTLNIDGSYSYNPSANYNGEDSVTIKVTNEYGLSTTQTIDLSIDPVNDVPVLTSDSINITLQDVKNANGQVQTSDVDNDTLTYTIATQAAHGTLGVDASGAWVYNANAGYIGVDSAVVKVDDGNGGVVEQTLNFTLKEGLVYEGENLVIDGTSDAKTLVMNTITKDDLRFASNGGDLIITVSDTKTITLKNYFTDPQAGIEVLQMAEGTISLSRNAINPIMYGGYAVLDANDHLVAGDDTGNWLIGNAGNDILLGAGGNDYVSGGSGNDLMVGGDGDDNLQGNSGNDAIYGDNGNDQIYAGEGNDTLSGGNSADMLFGENGDDMISGGSGNDTIYAGNGNDTLKSGSGNDFIDGSYGSDTYLFNIGDGNDTVVDSSAYGSSDTDKIIFGAGITKENLQILRDSYDLVFKVNDNDSMRVKYWFSGNQQNTIEQITFSDGSTLNTNDVNALAITKGTENSDWLFGIDTLGDNFYGMGGNDGIYSYGGNDFLSGGTGDDFMEGGSGSDTYLFNKGDGKDTINEWASWNSSDVDSVKFGNGITSNDVSFILSGTNLLIQYGQNDTIKVANTYNNASSSPIERIELSNGSYLTNNDMNLIIQQMSAYAVDKGISLTSNSDIQNNQALMQIVNSGWHNA